MSPARCFFPIRRFPTMLRPVVREYAVAILRSLSTVSSRPWAAMRFAAAVVPVLLVTVAALGQAPPSADSMLVSTHADENFGASSILAVQKGITSVIQFNLSGVPAGTTIQKASLRLFTDAVQSPGSFDVFQLDSPWSENAVSAQNAPMIGASATGGHPVAISRASRDGFVLVDITSLAQGWLSGAVANNGIALQLIGSSGVFSFDSKEAEYTSHEPELLITLAAPAGVQGAQGPPGIPGSQGPQGIPGAQGSQGVPGLAGVHEVLSTLTQANAFTATEVVAACGSQTLIAGGCDAEFGYDTNNQPPYIPPGISKSTPSGNQYVCMFQGGSGINMPVAAVAVCANTQ